jgi:hypothetical protein
VARVTDKDTDPASAADPGDVNVCAQVAGGAVPGELAARPGRVEEQLGEAAVQGATGAVAGYEVSG